MPFWEWTKSVHELFAGWRGWHAPSFIQMKRIICFLVRDNNVKDCLHTFMKSILKTHLSNQFHIWPQIINIHVRLYVTHTHICITHTHTHTHNIYIYIYIYIYIWKMKRDKANSVIYHFNCSLLDSTLDHRQKKSILWIELFLIIFWNSF